MFVVTKKRAGFTLFELLVVISIIGVIVAVATVAYSSAQKRARDAKRREDLQAVQKALEQYYALNNSQYPLTCYSSGETISVGGTVIMQSFPTDPKNSGDYVYSGSNCSAESYCYCAKLESVSGNSGADCNWSATAKDYFCVSARQ